MSAINKRYPVVLFIGDIAIFFLSLWLTLLIRYRSWPSQELWSIHLAPFSILFLVWLLAFYIAGLYEKRVVILRNHLPSIIFQALITNSIIAVLFFYFIPYFEITPKTSLFIYLIVSFVLIVGWRLYGGSILAGKRKQKAILIAGGTEMKELQEEVNGHSQYELEFITVVDLANMADFNFKKDVMDQVARSEVEIIAVDFKNEKAEPILPALYNLIFSSVVFIDMHRLYEDVFDRIPLSLITYSWFLENVSQAPKVTYDILKRAMDIIISIPLGIVSLIAYPFVYIAIKMDDGGPLFSVQERVGQNNKLMKIYKFRTMSNANDKGEWGGANANHITKIGDFLRKSRIDELPQLWNVILGSISLIGPRPEFQKAVTQYEQEIPYYGVRHLVKPGLSGWAQIYHDNHPHHGVVIEATKEKLSYDLFYIKNRSLILDITIALKTINNLISRSGL